MKRNFSLTPPLYIMILLAFFPLDKIAGPVGGFQDAGVMTGEIK